MWIHGSFVYTVVLLSLVVFVNTVTSVKDVCFQVLVSGAVAQPASNGLYELADVLHCNDKPAWKQRDGLDYLYYLEDGYYGWMIGSASCYEHTAFLIGVKSEANEPYRVLETWKEYNSTTQHFEENSMIIVECNEKYTACMSTPCHNNGACIGFANSSFSCTCHQGYAGRRCELQTSWPSGSITFVTICVSVLVFAFLLLVLLGILCYLRSRRQRQQLQLRNAVPSVTSQFGFNYTTLVNESTSGLDAKRHIKTNDEI